MRTRAWRFSNVGIFPDDAAMSHSAGRTPAERIDEWRVRRRSFHAESRANPTEEVTAEPMPALLAAG